MSFWSKPIGADAGMNGSPEFFVRWNARGCAPSARVPIGIDRTSLEDLMPVSAKTKLVDDDSSRFGGTGSIWSELPESGFASNRVAWQRG